MGHHDRVFVGDQYASAGVWGTPTSTANFCEEDYAVTRVIAEFVNSFTNLAYIWFALRYPRKNPNDGNKLNGHWPLDTLSTALFILGVNSFVFHATMHHSTQYCDEISMLVLGSALLHGVFTINQSDAVVRAVNGVVIVALGVLSANYIRTGDILFHVASFNTMILMVGLRTLYLVLGTGRPAQERNRLLRLFGKSLVVLAVAYTLWNVDLERCLELRRIRQAMGLPWAWVLELHGWWHILTALGASLQIRLTRELSA